MNTYSVRNGHLLCNELDTGVRVKVKHRNTVFTYEGRGLASYGPGVHPENALTRFVSTRSGDEPWAVQVFPVNTALIDGVLGVLQ